jgi:DNA polymerase III delta prime subunit
MIATASQPSLFAATTPEDRADQLREILAAHDTWLTREDLTAMLATSEREVRATMELLGADVVRGQSGFKLVTKLDRSELGSALQAADAYRSQGIKMLRYSVQLRRRLHQVIA